MRPGLSAFSANPEQASAESFAALENLQLDFGLDISHTVRTHLNTIAKITSKLGINKDETVTRWFRLMAHVCRTVYSTWHRGQKVSFTKGLNNVTTALERIQRDAQGSQEAAKRYLVCPEPIPAHHIYTRILFRGQRS